MKCLLAAVIGVALIGCGVSDEEQLGVSQDPLVSANGTLSCAGNDVLICHYPPGNRANHHSICVGPPAVAPHQRLHGDTIGACGTAGGPGGGPGGHGDDAGSEGGGGGEPGDAGSTGGGGGGGAVDAGPACGLPGTACQTDSACCAGSSCVMGACTPNVQ